MGIILENMWAQAKPIPVVPPKKDTCIACQVVGNAARTVQEPRVRGFRGLSLETLCHPGSSHSQTPGARLERQDSA